VYDDEIRLHQYCEEGETRKRKRRSRKKEGKMKSSPLIKQALRQARI